MVVPLEPECFVNQSGFKLYPPLPPVLLLLPGDGVNIPRIVNVPSLMWTGNEVYEQMVWC